MDICPKKIGFKNAIKKTIFETFWLKIILVIFDIAIKALKEKNKLIKWWAYTSYLIGIIWATNDAKVS